MNTHYPVGKDFREPEEDQNSFNEYGGGYYHADLVSPKEVWAGCSPEHAFSEDIAWPYKRQSLHKFHTLLEQERKVLWNATKAAGVNLPALQVEPQISAFYTSFPWPARASVGHTLFLEASKYKESILSRLYTYLEDSQRIREYGLNEANYKKVVGMTAEALGNRALFDMLEQVPRLDGVEFYRLFQAAVHSLNFGDLRDIINAVVLLGDVLPEPDTLKLHELTMRIMKALMKASQGYWQEATDNGRDGNLDIYLLWGSSLIRQLIRFLPPEKPSKPKASSKSPVIKEESNTPQPEPEYSHLPERKDGPPLRTLPPLNKPQPPVLEEGSSRLRDNLEKMHQEIQKDTSESGDTKEEDPDAARAKKILNDLIWAAEGASAQKNKWENMREDLVEDILSNNPFGRGPVEGQETNGICINREIGGMEVGGELFDRTVALCNDLNKVRSLRSRAAPIVKKLMGNLYPNTGKEFAMEYPCASGQMDPRRLPIAEVCDAAYRRYRTFNVTSPVGRSLLLIAADASGSLSDPQMQMCKCLMTAWLDSVYSARLQVLAGFYHSGGIRTHLSGPLVQWVYHPRKTPVYAPRDAVGAVANLPDSGSGAQSDALSLTYMLDEAASVSRGAFVYLTLISDCAFNKSYRLSEITAMEEVVETFKQAREQMDGRLHITLVGLGKAIPDKIKDAVDGIITVDEDALKSPHKVAENIGMYVAACIRNRREMMESNRRGI